jgi:hypothetical protein
MNFHEKLNTFLILLIIIISNAYLVGRNINHIEGFNIGKQIKKAIMKPIEAIIKIIEDVKNGIMGVINAIKNGIMSIIEAIKKIVAIVWNTIKMIIKEIVNLPRTIMTAIVKSIGNKKIRKFMTQKILGQKKVGKMYMMFAFCLAMLLLIITVLPMMLLMFVKTAVFGSIQMMISMIINFIIFLFAPPIPDPNAIMKQSLEMQGKMDVIEGQLAEIQTNALQPPPIQKVE